MTSILTRILKAAASGNGESGSSDSKEMSFLDHLDELRSHIIKAVLGIVIASIGCAFFTEYIVQKILLHPLAAAGLKAQVLTPYGIVMLYMETILLCGFILSMPNTLFWLWKFVSPGLLPKERRYASSIVGFTSLCFFAGVVFSYFILLPTSLEFFAHFGTENIQLNIAIDKYVSFVLAMLLGGGLVFELPMISYFLTKVGLLTPPFMRHYRRHAIVVILIVAAIVTPTPDIVTQSLLALPMFALYEVSILVCKWSLPREAEILEQPPAGNPE